MISSTCMHHCFCEWVPDTSTPHVITPSSQIHHASPPSPYLISVAAQKQKQFIDTINVQVPQDLVMNTDIIVSALGGRGRGGEGGGGLEERTRGDRDGLRRGEEVMEGRGGTFSSALSGVICSTLRMSNSIRSTMMMSSSSRRSHSWYGHQHHQTQTTCMPQTETEVCHPTFWHRSAKTEPRTFIAASTVNA